MPTYTNVSRGNLILSKESAIPPGKTCEMSEGDAASLPPGTVELVKKAEPPKPTKPEGK